MSDLKSKLDNELNKLELEDAVGKDVLIEIFKVLEDRTASGEDISEVTKEVNSLIKQIKDEGTAHRGQLEASVKELITVIGNLPEPPSKLDVTVSNPQKEVTFTNKKINVEGKVETKQGSKTLTAIRGLVAPLKGIQKKLGQKLTVKIIDSGDPKKPVAVRMSNGKKFIDGFVAAMGSSGWHVPFKKANGVAQEGLIDDDGRQIIRIGAEDIDNLGVIELVQGQFNTDGFFELLTAGSGGAGDEDALLMEGGDYILLESGDNILLE